MSFTEQEKEVLQRFGYDSNTIFEHPIFCGDLVRIAQCVSSRGIEASDEQIESAAKEPTSYIDSLISTLEHEGTKGMGFSWTQILTINKVEQRILFSILDSYKGALAIGLTAEDLSDPSVLRSGIGSFCELSDVAVSIGLTYSDIKPHLEHYWISNARYILEALPVLRDNNIDPKELLLSKEELHSQYRGENLVKLLSYEATKYLEPSIDTLLIFAIPEFRPREYSNYDGFVEICKKLEFLTSDRLVHLAKSGVAKDTINSVVFNKYISFEEFKNRVLSVTERTMQTEAPAVAELVKKTGMAAPAVIKT